MGQKKKKMSTDKYIYEDIFGISDEVLCILIREAALELLAYPLQLVSL